MPQVRKLAPEEVQTLEYKSKGMGLRKIIESEYDAFLADYSAGDYGEAALEAGDNGLTVKNRLKAAAARRDVGLQFMRTGEDTLRFKVAELDRSNGTTKAEPVAPPKRKGGRPKKTTA
jgi:hypothetical protein